MLDVFDCAAWLSILDSWRAFVVLRVPLKSALCSYTPVSKFSTGSIEPSDAGSNGSHQPAKALPRLVRHAGPAAL